MGPIPAQRRVDLHDFDIGLAIVGEGEGGEFTRGAARLRQRVHVQPDAPLACPGGSLPIIGLIRRFVGSLAPDLEILWMAEQGHGVVERTPGDGDQATSFAIRADLDRT